MNTTSSHPQLNCTRCGAESNVGGVLIHKENCNNFVGYVVAKPIKVTSSPRNPTIKLVDSDSVIEDWFDRYARKFIGSDELELLKLEVKGIRSIIEEH